MKGTVMTVKHLIRVLRRAPRNSSAFVGRDGRLILARDFDDAEGGSPGCVPLSRVTRVLSNGCAQTDYADVEVAS